jgi:prolyl-tRNA editing enzyme YbaK/EbsC (Cys-tRNA(Pro) deacylase)
MGTKSRMATAEETEAATGFRPGGVCPFGVSSIPIYIDSSLEAYDTVYPSCGNDSSGVATSFRQLLSITGGLSCDVCEPKQP